LEDLLFQEREEPGFLPHHGAVTERNDRPLAMQGADHPGIGPEPGEVWGQIGDLKAGDRGA
jgi:hypothetical protein